MKEEEKNQQLTQCTDHKCLKQTTNDQEVNRAIQQMVVVNVWHLPNTFRLDSFSLAAPMETRNRIS